jgi:hypothetical protein
MKPLVAIPLLLTLAAVYLRAQDPPAPGAAESTTETRYAVAVVDDATFYSSPSDHIPAVLNQVLVEPNFDLHYLDRWTFSTSLIGNTTTYFDNFTQLRVRETYAGLSAGDFDLTAGRKLVRWGTGYAFTAAGVLDPPRIPTDPTDRLNLNQGRDMLKLDWVHGPHAVTAAWSTAALAPAGSSARDTSAFRYNVLVHGFDTALIAGNDRGGDSFGALTFTRVVGQAWEFHGEAAWREQAAVLAGAKYVMRNGVTFIGEFYTPPNIPYYRDAALSPLAGRQHYAFFYAGKNRLRELPGWKQWDLSGSIVRNLDDHSYTGIFDVSRWFGNHFSAYTHIEIPAGSSRSDYGSAPYAGANSLGVRFHL